MADTNPGESPATSGARRYVLIHCPTGQPGPYEVQGVDGTPLATFETLVEAEQFATTLAEQQGARVLLSPLAQGHM